MKTFHRKIAPKKSLKSYPCRQVCPPCINRWFYPPHPLHGQCLGIGKNGINVKIVRKIFRRGSFSWMRESRRSPEHGTLSSNPNGPVPACIVGRLGHSKPLCFSDSSDSKNDSIFGRRREMQAPHDAMHRASMGATESQSNWPEMRKTHSSQEGG